MGKIIHFLFDQISLPVYIDCDQEHRQFTVRAYSDAELFALDAAALFRESLVNVEAKPLSFF